MRIGIITSEKGGGWHAEDLGRAIAAAGHEAVSLTWERLGANVVGGRSDAGDQQSVTSLAAGGKLADTVAMEQLDAVLPRSMPRGSLEQIIFRLDVLHRLEAIGVPVVNRPRALEVAIDKYLALSRMAAAGVPVPRTAVCQHPLDAMQAFRAMDGDCVLKPLFGSEGFGITRLTDEAVASRAFHALANIGAVLYLQQFVDHGGTDERVLLIDGQPIAGMRRVAADWRTNVARGGEAQAMDVSDAAAALARRAAEACGVDVAGVDIARDAQGEPWVLEVNAVPGWRALSRVAQVDVAARVVADVEQRVAARTR